MSYGIFPTFRTIGTRSLLSWTDVNIDGYVYVDGYRCQPSLIFGPISVDIRRGSPSNPRQTISFGPSDNTINAIIAKINAVFPGLADLKPDDNSCIRLTDPNYIEVISKTDTLRGTGLGSCLKSSANTNLTLRRADVNIGNDRFDFMSHPYVLDPGSNTVSLWPTIIRIDATLPDSPYISVSWENGVENSFVDGYSSDIIVDGYLIHLNYGYNTQISGLLDGYTKAISIDPASNFIFSDGRLADKIIKLNSGIPLFTFVGDFLNPPANYAFPVSSGPITLPIPRGATKMRVGIVPIWPGFAPAEPPLISIAVTQGAS